MIRLLFLILLQSTFLLSVAHAQTTQTTRSEPSYDDFIGVLYFVENGKKTKFLKIEKIDGNYVGREWMSNKNDWSDSIKLKKVVNEQFEETLPELKDYPAFAVGMALLLSVPPGWQFGKFKAPSKLALVTDYGGKNGTEVIVEPPEQTR